MIRLRDCIARGLGSTAAEREQVAAELVQVREVAATVDAKGDDYDVRLRAFNELMDRFAASQDKREQEMAALMKRWQPGLFIGDGTAERQGDPWAGSPFLPEDNYELERRFRTPKHHLRHIHGRAHAGVVLVQRGATLVPTLDAHQLHPAPFSHEELRSYLRAPEPPQQREARARAAVMRRARSEKQRPFLLAELQKRYLQEV